MTQKFSNTFRTLVIVSDPYEGEALIFESTLSSVPRPDRNTLKAFRSNFFRKLDNQHLPLLEGYSSEVYNDPDDLVALHNSKPPNRLTMFVKNYFGFLFKVSCCPEARTHKVITLILILVLGQQKESIQSE